MCYQISVMDRTLKLIYFLVQLPQHYNYVFIMMMWRSAIRLAQVEESTN